MKELSIPASKLQPEINREAFVKSFVGEGRRIKRILTYLQELENKGLVPDTVGLRKEPKERKIYLYMERVNGFALKSFSPEDADYRLPLDLAQKVASLFKGFYDAGYYHTDPHYGNIMYDQVNSRCVAVDLDSIRSNKNNHIPLKRYVQDFAELMTSIYLGDKVEFVLGNLLRKGEVQRYLDDEWEEFNREIGAYKHKGVEGDFYDSRANGVLRQYSYKLVSKLISDRVGCKINPVVKDFVLRGLNPSTAAKNFDEVLALEPEALEKM